MKKKLMTLLFFVVTVMCSVVAAQTKDHAVSFSGQNGRDPNAKNGTSDQFLDAVVRGIFPTSFAYHSQLPHAKWQKEYARVLQPVQQLWIDRFNVINDIEPVWVDPNGAKLKITSIDEVETIFKAFVNLEEVNPNTKFVFLSLSTAFNGKFGKTSRGVYSSREKFFVLTRNGKKFVLCSAICFNPPADPADMQKYASAEGGEFEDWDDEGTVATSSKKGGGNVINSHNTTTNNYYYGSSDGEKPKTKKSGDTDLVLDDYPAPTPVRYVTTAPDYYSPPARSGGNTLVISPTVVVGGGGFGGGFGGFGVGSNQGGGSRFSDLTIIRNSNSSVINNTPATVPGTTGNPVDFPNGQYDGGSGSGLPSGGPVGFPNGNW